MSDSYLKGRQSYIPEGMTLIKFERINNNAYKIDLPLKFSVHSTFKSPFHVGDDWFEDKSFWRGGRDKNHSVSNAQTRPITRSKAKKIQQAFILHLQNWISLVQPSFHVLQADSIKEGPFGASEVNICEHHFMSC